MFSRNQILASLKRHQQYSKGEASEAKSEPRLVIEPFNEKQLNPNSYNLRLSPELLVYKTNPRYQFGVYSGGNNNEPLMNEPLLPSSNHNLEAFHDGAIRRDRNDYEIAGIWKPIELKPWVNVLDMAKDNPTYKLTIPPEGLVLLPGRLYLGSTEEYTETHNAVPCIEGRSSVGRLGLCVHVTAGFGDCFFKGQWTLELTVVEPLRIYAGVEICQIAYTNLIGAHNEGGNYQGKYQNQRGPKASQLWRDFLPEE